MSDENKTTGPEVMTRDQLKTALSDVTQDVFKQLGYSEMLEKIMEMEKTQTGFFAKGAPVDQVAASKDNQEKGQLAGQVIRVLAKMQKTPRFDPMQYAKDVYGEGSPVHAYVEKAMSAASAEDGGFILQDTVAREIIELLRASAIITQLGPRFVPLSGKLTLPKHTTGAAGGWIGENANLPATTVKFGQITLDPKKYASLVPLSNDLLRREGGSDADNFVRDDMVSDIRTAVDIAAIRADGTAAQPKGLRHWAATVTAANGTINLDNVTADLAGMIQRMGDNNVAMVKPAWIIEWRTWRYLWTLRDSNGNLVFAEEMNKGTLLGFPFARTSQIPRNLGGGSDETEITFADFNDVIFGQHQDLLVDVSDTAAYHDGSAVVASFSLDQTVIRAITELDIAVRHNESVEILNAVKWGS